MLAREAGATAVGRLCPRCGSSEHGRPWARVADGPAPWLSLAYARDAVVVAWSWAAPLGVDIESVDTRGAEGDLAAWTRAEALLKSTGEALSRWDGDPTALPSRASAPLALGPAYVGWVALDASAEQRVDVELDVVPAVGG